MTHCMKLVPWAFAAVASGTKTVEMRLFDEKRAKIKAGDTVEFENTETAEKITRKVVGLTRFADFASLYAHYPKAALGYSPSAAADPADMAAFYPAEEIRRCGVLAIELSPH